MGKGASGIQIADELREAGKKVIISVSTHRRRPRIYLDKDILWWADRLGIFSAPAKPGNERLYPAPQLIGTQEKRSIDLGILQEKGVRLFGRLLEASGQNLHFGQDLNEKIAKADEEMHQMLNTIKEQAALQGFTIKKDEPSRIQAIPYPDQINLQDEGIGNIIWATGYRRNYSWLNMNLTNTEGELVHDKGVLNQPGLYVIGLRRQIRYNSNFVNGVGPDAEYLGGLIQNYLKLQAV